MPIGHDHGRHRTGGWGVGIVVALLTLTGCIVPPSEPSGGPTSGAPGTPVTTARTVGVANDIPGLSELTSISDNTRAGFDVSLASWLGEFGSPAFRPAFIGVTAEQRENVLLDGTADYVVNALSITDRRKQTIGIIGPYLLTRQGVMTRIGAAPVTRLADLEGRSVCTVQGSTSELQLSPLRDQGDIILTTEVGNSRCVDRLLAGELDVFSTDQLILSGFAGKYDGQLAVSSFTFGSAEEYGIGYPKGDLALCESLRDGVRRFILEGRWDDFFRIHFPDLRANDGFRPDPGTLDRCE